MHYQIIKGWPDESALDPAYPAAATMTKHEGVICSVNATGKVVIANDNDGFAKGFLIGREYVNQACTLLMGDFIIKCDTECLDSTKTYAAGTAVTTDSQGRFVPKTAGSADTLGKVIVFDSTSQEATIICHFA